MSAGRHLLLLALVGAVFGCAPRTPDTTADETAIRSTTQALVSAMLAGDSVAAAATFAPSAVMFPPNEPAVSGQAAIRAWSHRLLSTVPVKAGSVSVDAVHVGGDWAVSYGNWSMTVSMGGTTATDTTRYMLLWQRQPSGDWLIARDVWNSGQPVSQ
ncbi:MAG TPA: nuclear transport factor 2 family protein [Gemmatimonadales bacterium]|nr:nuclear transport factor 2 family protein [Gemmatimonadales bacterium]